MIHIEVKSEGDPRKLADLIASTQKHHPVGVAVGVAIPVAAAEGEFLREYIAQQDAERPAHDQLETVNFQRLDDENDWTDV